MEAVPEGAVLFLAMATRLYGRLAPPAGSLGFRLQDAQKHADFKRLLIQGLEAPPPEGTGAEDLAILALLSQMGRLFGPLRKSDFVEFCNQNDKERFCRFLEAMLGAT